MFSLLRGQSFELAPTDTVKSSEFARSIVAVHLKPCTTKVFFGAMLTTRSAITTLWKTCMKCLGRRNLGRETSTCDGHNLVDESGSSHGHARRPTSLRCPRAAQCSCGSGLYASDWAPACRLDQPTTEVLCGSAGVQRPAAGRGILTTLLSSTRPRSRGPRGHRNLAFNVTCMRRTCAARARPAPAAQRRLMVWPKLHKMTLGTCFL